MLAKRAVSLGGYLSGLGFLGTGLLGLVFAAGLKEAAIGVEALAFCCLAGTVLSIGMLLGLNASDTSEEVAEEVKTQYIRQQYKLSIQIVLSLTSLVLLFFAVAFVASPTILTRIGSGLFALFVLWNFFKLLRISQKLSQLEHSVN